jgi:hypothetical protein
MILLLLCSTRPQLAFSYFIYFITGTTKTKTHKAKNSKNKDKNKVHKKIPGCLLMSACLKSLA